MVSKQKLSTTRRIYQLQLVELGWLSWLLVGIGRQVPWGVNSHRKATDAVWMSIASHLSWSLNLDSHGD